MIGVGLKIAQNSFFDRMPADERLDKAKLRVLSRYGAFVRRTAKGLLRPARQKRLSELGPKERQIFRIQQAIAKKEGRRPPKRANRISDPGDPPRLHTRPASASPLKKLIFFIYDRVRESVLIGPTRWGAGVAPERLEHGRGKYQARPFMGPANAKEAPRLPSMWRDAL